MKFKNYYNDYIIHVDLDGVLCDFEGQFEKLGHGSSDEMEERDKKKFWEIIYNEGIKFWSQMPWKSDGKKLWDHVNKLKNCTVKILSAPPKSDDGVEGKKIWIKRELGPKVQYILVPAKNKRDYAGKNKILIDDKKRNIDQWNEDGGVGILHKNTKDTIQRLNGILG